MASRHTPRRAKCYTMKIGITHHLKNPSLRKKKTTILIGKNAHGRLTVTDCQAHQQQLEQQEQEESVYLRDDDNHEIHLHIWGDEDSVYVNLRNWPVSMSVNLTAKQAQKMVQMLNNALRRAT